MPPSNVTTSQTSEDRYARTLTALAYTGLFAVWILAAWSYREGTLIADTARDGVAAARILVDGDFPAAGPALYGTWVLSPLWFWFFAALVWALPSLTWVYVTLGALAMTKLLLAWRIGLRLSGPLFGALFAVFLFWPGWSFIEPVIVTHTNLVQATGLLFVLAALRAYASPDAFRIVLMFAALALALATHPTNLLYAPLAFLPCFSPLAERRVLVYAGSAGIGVVLLSLVPGLLHEAASQGASQSFLHRLPEPGALRRWPQALRALLFDAQGSPLQQVGLHWPRLASALGATSLVIAILSCVGWLRIARGRRIAFLCALLALAAWCGFLAASRPTTPTWMLLSAQPLAYGLGAYGIASMLERASPRWRFAGFIVLLASGVLAASAYAAARFQRAGAGIEWHATDRVSDVSQAPVARAINSPHFPPRAQDALARLGCEGPARLGLFGDLAVLAETTQGASSRLRDCRRDRWPMLGSGPGLKAIAGIPAATATKLGLGGSKWANFRLLPVLRATWPQAPRELRFNVAYPPFDARDMQSEPLEVTELLAGDDVLVVTGLMSGFASPLVTLAAAGRALAPAADTGSSLYFRCPSRAPCKVTGSAAAGSRDMLQVFVLKGEASISPQRE